MADKVIHVNVTATKSQKVNVSAGNVQNQITATTDSSQYYSNLAKNWAISDKLINNEDYSAKRYANLAKQDAERANTFTNSCLETYNNVVDYSAEAIDNIVATKNSAISDISESGHKAVTDIETEKQNTITEIQDITINNKEEIEKLSNQEQNKIVSLGIESRANVDLSNLSATGEKHFLNKSQITNCITEIPQRIKLELSGALLKLKAGSKVSVSTNGTFEDVNIANDITGAGSLHTGEGTRELFVCYSPSENTLITIPVAYTYSSATTPTSLLVDKYAGWFDTSTNTVKYTNDGTTWNICSLPICMGKPISGTGWGGRIDQIFNGFGYIGSTIWVDKGVKGLIPNGRNEDGTLKNIEVVTTKVTTHTNTANDIRVNSFIINSAGDVAQRTYLGEFATAPTPSGYWGLYYNTTEQIFYYNSGGTWVKHYGCIVGIISSSSTGITLFEPKLPFRAVDYNEFNSTPHITATYVSGTSGYNVYSNKYCEQWGQVTSSGTITFLKSFKDKNYSLIITPNTSTGWGQGIPLNQMGWTAKTATGFTTTADVNCTKEWRACGYIV